MRFIRGEGGRGEGGKGGGEWGLAEVKGERRKGVRFIRGEGGRGEGGRGRDTCIYRLTLSKVH